MNFSDFKNTIFLFSQKKFFQIKNYGKNLKTDMRNLQCTLQSVKHFASCHPWLAAKVVHEGLGILSYIFLPSIYCIDNECKKSKIDHLSQQSKNYFFLSYQHFFNFIFKFNDEYHNKSNFFSSNYFEKEDFMAHCTRFIPFPILTSLTKMYALFRTKPAEKVDEKESNESEGLNKEDEIDEDYGEALLKLFEC
jgi:hypothetical protein